MKAPGPQQQAYIAEWRFFRSQGITGTAELAARLGVSERTVYRYQQTERAGLAEAS